MGDPTAMEPAAGRREHGSQNPGRLTCANRSSHERSEPGRTPGPPNGLVKGQKRPLTCMRALPEVVPTTSALATQMMTALDEGSFSW